MSGKEAYWLDRPNPMVLTGGEIRVLFCGAVRYAVCRGTFASKETAEAVKRHIADIDSGTLMVIARDIEIELDAWGNEAVRYFENLPKLIEEELERRGDDRIG